MPGRRGNAARGAKSDTLCAVPVGFAIPEAEMRGAAHGHLGRAFFVCGAFAGAETNSTCGFIPVTDGQTGVDYQCYTSVKRGSVAKRLNKGLSIEHSCEHPISGLEAGNDGGTSL